MRVRRMWRGRGAVDLFFSFFFLFLIFIPLIEDRENYSRAFVGKLDGKEEVFVVVL